MGVVERRTQLDRDPQRMDRLRANLTRLGYAPALVTADALAYTPPSLFDGVLLERVVRD